MICLRRGAGGQAANAATRGGGGVRLILSAKLWYGGDGYAVRIQQRYRCGDPKIDTLKNR
jgi:hypothetical protein